MLPISKLILGTVQFGLAYGINNQAGKPSYEEVSDMLRYAYQAGIRTLDTASAYGDAIDVIGRFHQSVPERFGIINKLHAKTDEVNVADLIETGLEKLQLQQFEAYLFHNYTDYLHKPGVVAQLEAEKKKGTVKKIGVSIYTNEEFKYLLQENKVDLIQLPYNVLDNDNLRGDMIRQAKEQGITIHTRSVFLQGLFFTSPDQLPDILRPMRSYLMQLHTIAWEERISLAALALAYVLRNEAVEGVLIGVDRLAQLQENIEQAGVLLSADAIEKINAIAVTQKELLNPVNWK